jgi:hypothetical protein
MCWGDASGYASDLLWLSARPEVNLKIGADSVCELSPDVRERLMVLVPHDNIKMRVFSILTF